MNKSQKPSQFVKKQILLSKLLTATILCLLWSADVFAKVNLYVLHPGEGQIALVFPASDKQSLKVQIERYIQLVSEEPDLMVLEPHLESLRSQLTSEGAVPLKNMMDPSKINLALIANEFSDLERNSPRVKKYADFFAQARIKSFLLPLAGDLHLENEEKIEYHTEVSRYFGMLVGMGGDDVHPHLYQEQITHSARVSFVRDYSELQLIRAYNQLSSGLYFGTCRGHQIGAVARGDRMYQDLTLDRVANTHDHSMRGDFRSEEGMWHHIDVHHPLLVNLFGGTRFEVNSFHHQSVHMTLGSSSQLGAVSSSDGVIEALVSADGRSIGLQFHLEALPKNGDKQSFRELGRRFVLGLAEYAKFIQNNQPPIRACHLVL